MRITLASVKNSPLKKEPFYSERDEEKRREFDEKMSKPMLPGTDVVYIDECGVDKFMGRQYGRSKRGQRVYLPEPGRKYKRINIVAGQRNGETLALRTYLWAMTAVFFEIWFMWELCPLLKRGSIIIMDNASFHRKKVLEKIAESFGCVIVWLPPYSPDKNKIEKLWANLKNWLRLFSRSYETIQAAITVYFQLK